MRNNHGIKRLNNNKRQHQNIFFSKEILIQFEIISAFKSILKQIRI